MILELTREQRQTIDAHRGQAVYVVDPDRRETFVLLPSSDFDKVRAMLGYPTDSGPWTEEKNRRRVELIDRKIVGTITADQLAELTGLQREAEEHFDQVAPPPTQGLCELHQQLLNHRGRHQ